MTWFVVTGLHCGIGRKELRLGVFAIGEKKVIRTPREPKDARTHNTVPESGHLATYVCRCEQNVVVDECCSAAFSPAREERVFTKIGVFAPNDSR